MGQGVMVLREGEIGTILLDRPQVLNAMNEVMWRGFDAALDSVIADPTIRVAILAGEGRAFCAGADLKEMGSLSAEIATGKVALPELRRVKQLLQGTTRKMRGARTVFVAAVHGYAVGAGCELALSCDLIVAGETARFGFPEVTVGLTITNGGSYFLPRLVGLARAKELAFTGDFIDAREAHRIGLVNRVVPDAAVLDEALALARKVASRAPLAVEYHKQALNLGAESDLETALAFEAEAIVLAVASEDHREGARAFFEKREPKFKGR